MSRIDRDRLVALRREFHRHPEPAWREFWTTARIVEELEAIGVDDLYVGEDALSVEDRIAVPDDDAFDEWLARARDRGVDEADLEAMAGGYTGCVAVVECGDGPTVGLRVDIDGLPQTESTDDDHLPAREGFRSETGAMHACGHDGHATLGLAVVEAIRDSDFSGTLKVFFQPAEEVIGGAKAIAESEHVADLDYLYAVHLGLNHPTGEVVAGIDGFLAVEHVDVTFTGAPAHAGDKPEAGRNAVQAMAAATQNLYGISRHADGATRINVGVVEGGTASNIVPEHASMKVEVRGHTTELKDYMRDRVREVVAGAAEMHGCEYDVTVGGEAPSAVSDDALVDVVQGVASETAGVDSVLESDELGGSEDATFLMKGVQERGGLACYVCVGTDHPGVHHSATFDVDEDSLPIGVDVLVGALERTSQERP